MMFKQKINLVLRPCISYDFQNHHYFVQSIAKMYSTQKAVNGTASISLDVHVLCLPTQVFKLLTLI